MSYFSASKLLIDYLKNLGIVPAANVRSAPSMEWVADNAIDQSLSVIFFDDQPIQQAVRGSRGRDQYSDQFWMVVITVRHVANASAGALDRSEEINQTVLQKLQGYKLSTGHGELIRVRCPVRKGMKNSFTHYPFLFSTRILTRANHLQQR